MKKRKLLGLAVLVLVLIGLSQSFLYRNEVKASSVKTEKDKPQFVMVEISEEEYLARLNEVDNQANSNKNINTNETIALPTPMPSQNETIALPTPIPSQNMAENKSQETSIAASYTSTNIPYYFDLYTGGGDYMCTGKEECTVWYYTDGKVHLYRRIIQLTNGNANISYGSIINTDGSVSYTTGDNINKYFLFGGWEYHYIDFTVTNSYYNYSTYWN